MIAYTESNQQETTTAEEVPKIHFPTKSFGFGRRTMSSLELGYWSGDETDSDSSTGSAIDLTAHTKQSSGSKGVGFNLDANTIHHNSDCPKHKKKKKARWYSSSEVDAFRDHYIKGVARQSSFSEENKRKETMLKSKAVVIYSQGDTCPLQLANMYKGYSERSQDQANKAAVDHQDEVKEFHQRAPKKKSQMKKMMRRLSM